MQEDLHLEELSDLVRNGTPIDFMDAIAVIHYQNKLRQQQRSTNLAGHVKRCITLIWKALSLRGFFERSHIE